MVIREWHVVISGFTQQSGTLNGCVQIWGELIRLAASRPDARVELLTWNDNVANLAELISRIAPEIEQPIVNIYGYSWGGMTAANFARELRRRSIDVNQMVLSDAVYRHWFNLGQWRALVPSIPIWIPDNVKRVKWFRQKENWPRGHDLRADNPGKTMIEPPVVLQTDHCWMDDHKAFRNACTAAAKGSE